MAIFGDRERVRHTVQIASLSALTDTKLIGERLHAKFMIQILTYLLTAALLTGCANAHNPADPLEPLNRSIYKFNNTVDKAVLKPIAQGYSSVMPTLGKVMVSNFFSNLDDVVVTTNDVLQFKLVQACSDGMRFLVNSTVGVFGLIDIASTGPLKKHYEDFGQTLGTWGVGNGPYLVLPILGPSTLRDSIGDYVDTFPNPTRQIQDIPTRNQLYITERINHRSELLDQEKILDDAMLDPYEFVRDAYLLRRISKVYDGNPPREKYDEDLSSDSSTTTPNITPVDTPKPAL